MKFRSLSLDSLLVTLLSASLGVYVLSQIALPTYSPPVLPSEDSLAQRVIAELEPISCAGETAGTERMESVVFNDRKSVPFRGNGAGVKVVVGGANWLSKQQREKAYLGLERGRALWRTDDLLAIRLVNASDSAAVITEAWGRMPMQREALTPEGEWEPVEHSRQYQGWLCGTGAFREIPIPQGEMLEFAAKRLTGDYRTLIRVKVRIGGQVLVSEPYRGSVSPCQFRRFDPPATKDPLFMNKVYL